MLSPRSPSWDLSLSPFAEGSFGKGEGQKRSRATLKSLTASCHGQIIAFLHISGMGWQTNCNERQVKSDRRRNTTTTDIRGRAKESQELDITQSNTRNLGRSVPKANDSMCLRMLQSTSNTRQPKLDCCRLLTRGGGGGELPLDAVHDQLKELCTRRHK